MSIADKRTIHVFERLTNHLYMQFVGEHSGLDKSLLYSIILRQIKITRSFKSYININSFGPEMSLGATILAFYWQSCCCFAIVSRSQTLSPRQYFQVYDAAVTVNR